MTTAQSEITFARLGDKGYMGGVNLAAIVADTATVFPEVRRGEITPVPEQSIPREYSWSVQRVKEFRDWEWNGTYLLMRNFETCQGSFRRYFPSARVE